MQARKRRAVWALWGLSTLVAAGVLAAALLREDNRRPFLPGPTSRGHYQIELACAACHTSPFGGGAVIQDACVNCHGRELKVAKDAHPKSKFTDPRNADRVKELDATRCVTCHVEHRPEITQKMLLTRPLDYCISCHRDIASERPSHKDMAFNTCADAGCHNFHDNRALYEDFLLKHAHEPAMLAQAKLPSRELLAWYLATLDAPPAALTQAEADAPKDLAVPADVLHDWAGTAHAKAGVNCTGCHQTRAEGDNAPAWIERPAHTACQSCHQPEVKGFLAGKHGMRLAQELPPMQPRLARIPMREDVAHRELSCTSCHGAHRFDTRVAATEACLGCHADQHSLAFNESAHGRLWTDVVKGGLADGAGVSCASCHMPRIQWDDGMLGSRTAVEHNQNDALRPNEKMIRPVCLHCHGMQFALDSLADPALIENNFNGQPARHVPSIDMALRHLEEDRRRREADAATTGERR